MGVEVATWDGVAEGLRLEAEKAAFGGAGQAEFFFADEDEELALRDAMVVIFAFGGLVAEKARAIELDVDTARVGIDKDSGQGRG